MAYDRFIQRDFKFLADRPGRRTRRLRLPGFLRTRPNARRLPGLHPRTWALAGGVALITALSGWMGNATPEPDTRYLRTALPIPVMNAVPPEPAQPDPEWTVTRVRSGDTLADIFDRQGLSPRTLHEVVNLDADTRQLTRIYPGDEVLFDIAEPGKLAALRYELDETRLLHVARAGDGFTSQIIERPLERRIVNASGVIESSLFLAGQNAGLSDALIMQLAAIFGWDIDFILDIRSGDSFTLLYEEIWRDGERLRDGAILAAEFVNRGKAFQAVRYTAGDSARSDYYDAEGRNLRKEFLRSPMDVTRVTSRFTMKRFHPILKVNRPHRGVDYGANTGTPVRATGDGRVTFASRNASYGNHVIIQHANQYKTLYAHLSKFGNGVRRGTRVRQGQIIGYVGATGLATAPHLHYEFRENGVHRDPLRIRFPKAEPLPAGELVTFRQQAAPLLARLDTLRSHTLMADAGGSPGAASAID